MKKVVITNNKTAPVGARATPSAGQTQLMNTLTARFQTSRTDNVEGILSFSNVLHDAYYKLEVPNFNSWLTDVAKMGESSASKFRDIAANRAFDDLEIRKILPMEWTKLAQLSRIPKHAKFCKIEDKGASKIKELCIFLTTATKQKKKNKKGEYIKDKKGNFVWYSKFPTHLELNAKIDTLLEKKRESLERAEELVTNDVEVADEVKRIAAAAKARVKAAEAKAELADRTAADATRKLAETAKQLAKFHAPDPVSGVKKLSKAGAPLSMSLPASSFKADNNKIVFENFGAAFQKKMQPGLQSDMLELLHDHEMTNTMLIVRQEVGAKKLAA